MLKSKRVAFYVYKNHTIDIYYDSRPENNPRKYQGNLGTIFYNSNKYELGDVKVLDWSVIEEFEKSESCVYLPVYAAVTIDGFVLSTNPIGGFCEAGKCGIIYNTKQNLDILKNSFHKEKDDLLGSFSDYDWAISIFKKEIRVFSDFLEGRVYGYEIKNRSGEVLDSCWGYIGIDIQEIYDEAKDIIDKCYAKEEEPIVLS
jgi:hypothetical protein